MWWWWTLRRIDNELARVRSGSDFNVNWSLAIRAASTGAPVRTQRPVLVLCLLSATLGIRAPPTRTKRTAGRRTFALSSCEQEKRQALVEVGGLWVGSYSSDAFGCVAAQIERDFPTTRNGQTCAWKPPWGEDASSFQNCVIYRTEGKCEHGEMFALHNHLCWGEFGANVFGLCSMFSIYRRSYLFGCFVQHAARLDVDTAHTPNDYMPKAHGLQSFRMCVIVSRAWWHGDTGEDAVCSILCLFCFML